MKKPSQSSTRTAIRQVGERLRRQRGDHHLRSFDRPVLIHHYPTSIKPVTCAGRQRPEFALALNDRAGRHGEIIGGASAIHDYDLPLKRPERHKLARRVLPCGIGLRSDGSVAGLPIGNKWPLESNGRLMCGNETNSRGNPLHRMIYRVYLSAW